VETHIFRPIFLHFFIIFFIMVFIIFIKNSHELSSYYAIELQ